MKFLKRKLMLGIIFLISCLNIFAYINLSPSTLDKNIGKGAYEEYTLWNETSIPFRYKITPVAMTENNKVKDMSKWVEVYPKIVTVNPQESQKFKVYIKAPKDSLTGDYGTFLNIRQMSAPKIKGEKEQQSLGAGMIIMVNVNLGIYGYVGDENPQLNCTEPLVYKKDNKSYLKMKVENKTNRLVKVKVEVEGKKGYIYPIGDVRAFKGELLGFDHEIKNLKDMKAKKVILTDVETGKIIKEIKIKNN